jgi:predicted transcriptional regulator
LYLQKCVTKHIGTNTTKAEAMTESTFTFRVDEDLKAAFTAAAKGNDRSAAQILRETMREYIAAEAPPTPEYVEWLRGKVEKSRAQIAAGEYYTNEEMEERMAEKRAKLRELIAQDKAAIS